MGFFVLGHWALGMGHWALGMGHWALGMGHGALGIGHWALGIGHRRDESRLYNCPPCPPSLPFPYPLICLTK